jgi:hypothetical protein
MRTVITTRQEFERYLKEALDKMKRLSPNDTGDPTLFAVLRQLESITEWTADGEVLTGKQKSSLVMGLQASREMAGFPAEQDLVCALHSYIEARMPSRRRTSTVPLQGAEFHCPAPTFDVRGEPTPTHRHLPPRAQRSLAVTTASFGEFWRRLNDAMVDVDRLAATDSDPMIGSIQRQLRFVGQWTQGGHRPAQADLDKLTFGLMASRSIHEVDSRLANELYELASYLTFWSPNEPLRT